MLLDYYMCVFLLTDCCKDLTQRTVMLSMVKMLRYLQVVRAASVNQRLGVARYVSHFIAHLFSSALA